jgi:hypothetical protein
VSECLPRRSPAPGDDRNAVARHYGTRHLERTAVGKPGPRPSRWGGGDLLRGSHNFRGTGHRGTREGASGPLLRVRPAWAAAWGWESPVGQMVVTTSRRQLRRREAGWEGSPRRIRGPRDTNRIGGGAVWASQHDVAKPVAIKRPQRKCGGRAEKVAALIRGDLCGCPGMPDHRCGVRRVGRDGGGREAAARRGEVSRGRSTGGIDGRWEGPNAKPSVRTFELVAVALTAANPVWGLAGEV